MGRRSLLEAALGGLAPGFPAVLTGPAGSGRTVLCLEVAHAFAASGRTVALVTGEPARLLLHQAASLDLDLGDFVRDGRLVLLELTPEVAAQVRIRGGDALGRALGEQAPEAELLVVDPLSALTAELVDEVALRSLVRSLFDAGARQNQAMVVTVEDSVFTRDPALERVLKEACGSFVELEGDGAGGFVLQVSKSRAAGFAPGPVHFGIGTDGVRQHAAEAALVSRGTTTGEVAEAAVPEAAMRPMRDGNAPVRDEAGEAGEDAGTRPRVLIVEDDPIAMALMSEWLKERYDVAQAEDGFAAMTALMSHKPHVVILDLQLPRIDGFEVLRGMRSGGVGTPVLVVSGTVARASDRVRVLVLGANDLLHKPAQRFELLQKVDTLLRNASSLSTNYDFEDVEVLLAGATSMRILDDPTFRDRLERACRFGEEYGLPSVFLSIAATGEEQCKRLIDAGSNVLRAEDAVVELPHDRALFLLVSTDLSVANLILARFTRVMLEAGGSVEGLRWRAELAEPKNEGKSWDPLFEDLVEWPDAE